MEEGTIPVPHTTLIPKSDDDVVPLQVLSHFGGTGAAGAKVLLSVQGFLTYFSRVPFLNNYVENLLIKIFER